jgi:hypothetical protein
VVSTHFVVEEGQEREWLLASLSFCDCDGRIVGLTGCGYEIRSFSHDIERGVEELDLEVILLVEF